ncbi:MAG: hypothetical protein Q7T89_03960 [Anaerolineales bacterium]|nr:hypothetical protein [Anaerolineales bacterium]
MFNHLLISLVFLLAQTVDISIVSPQPGDILRGQVEVVGNMDVPNFASAELAFSYASNPADRFAWFAIQTFSQPVQNNPTLAVWDTTTLTDGDYVLHLRVFLQDGSTQDVVISDLKIRNDDPVPTDIPTATALYSQPANPLPASTELPVTVSPSFSSPTPLPANPASVTSSSIYSNFARGGLLVLVLFFMFGIFLKLRSKA